VGTFNGFQGDFIAGDDRINENPVLASLHNLFLMEHNRVAQYIAQRRPGLTDEVIYQEARRIVGAELQQVTYNEYLPIVLGSNAMSRFNLNLGNQYTTYNPNLDPTIINSFATAAYRFGHSLVNGVQRLVSVPSQSVGSFQIRDNYFQSGQITQSNGQGYDWILGGLMTQNSQAFDPFVTVDLSDFLFRAQGNDFGSDLIARNIQRGRDHALPSYYRFRQWCGLPAVSSDQFVKPPEVRQDAWTELVNSRLYQRPEDIDLFTGGLMEIPVAGGLTGPTFNCIKANQFARSKEGDRYFFTHSGTPNTFNTGQIQALRARTLGDIMCQNSQLSQTTRNVFLIPSSGNTWIPCSAQSRILNLDLFLP
jgi:peroxidase